MTVNNATTASITMNPGHAFDTTIAGTSYQFVNITERILQPTAGVYTYSNIPIYEGSWVTTKFTVDVSDIDQLYIIPNDNVDISTLAVSIQTSAEDTTTTTFTKANNLVEIKSTTNAYFIQETVEGEWQVYFGDGVVGTKPIDGNIVTLSYVVTTVSYTHLTLPTKA